MKRSLRKHVSVFLAGAMTLSTVFAQTSAFAAENSASDAGSDDAVVSGGAVVSDVKSDNGSKAQATEVKALDDNTSGSGLQVLEGTGFQALIGKAAGGEDAKVKNDWKIGDKFDADLLFNDANTVGINNFTIKLTYNSDVIDLVDAADGDVVYDVNGTTYKLISAARVKAQAEKGAVDDTTKVKSVVLAAVAGLPDDGTNISALDKNYKATGSKLATLTFEVKSLGKGIIGIEQYSDASVLNTLNAQGEIVTVKDSDFALVGDEINFTKTEAEFNIAPAGYDIVLSASAKDGVDVAGKLAGGFADESGVYKVNLIDDADITGLIAAIKAVDAGADVTIAEEGTDGVKVTYTKEGKVIDTVFKFAAAETKVAYKATSTDGITVEKTGKDAALTVKSDVSGSKASGTTVTLTDGVDAESYAKNLVDQLNKIEYVTAEYKVNDSDSVSEAVVTITFEKKANAVANKTNAVGPVVDTVTITSAKASEKEFVVSGQGKSETVTVSAKDNKVTVNGVEVTLSNVDGKLLVPVNFNIYEDDAAATNGVVIDKEAGEAVVDGVTLKFVRFADLDEDGDITLTDYIMERDIMRGKDVPGANKELATVDDDDESIDLADYIMIRDMMRGTFPGVFPAEEKYNMK